jgi:flagellar biosynthesis protein FlhF
METTRFRAQTVADAVAAAYAVHGPEVDIVSTEMVAARGLRGLIGLREVEVAVDAASAPPREASARRRAMRPADDSGDSAMTKPAAEPAPMTPTTLGALARLRAAARQATAPVPAPDRPDPLVAQLLSTGLHTELAERVARAVPRAARRPLALETLETALATELGGLVSGDEPYAPVELFVGPPGAGKTTTIAKIAARERARRGARLSLLAADGFRVGAVEQLRLYADMIGSPFDVARTPAEIERSLAATASPILVDTAGRSIGDARALEVSERLSSLPGLRTHVVLPAGSSVRQAARLLDAYGHRARRVVLTRLDEGDSIAPLLKLIAERDLTVSYLGTGQRVPEDLERATAAALARHILGLDGPEARPA